MMQRSRVLLALAVLMFVARPARAQQPVVLADPSQAAIEAIQAASEAIQAATEALLSGINVESLDGQPVVQDITTDCDTGAGTQTCAIVPLGFAAAGGAVIAPGTTANGMLVDVSRLPPSDNDLGNVDLEFSGIAAATGVGVSNAQTQRLVPAQTVVWRSLTLDEVKEEADDDGGELCSIWFTNTNTTTVFLKVWNLDADNVTVGTTATTFTIGLPGNTTDDITGALGISNGCWGYSTGLTFAAVTGALDNNSTPPTDDIILAVFTR